jgi:hypothetical protein
MCYGLTAWTAIVKSRFEVPIRGMGENRVLHSQAGQESTLVKSLLLSVPMLSRSGKPNVMVHMIIKAATYPIYSLITLLAEQRRIFGARNR